MKENLQIAKKINNNEVTLCLDGSVNNNTAKILNDELQSLDYKNLNLIIDLANTDYITSAGLRVLLIARKKIAENSVKIINVNESIAEVFHISGFDSFFKIEKDSKKIDENNFTYVSALSLRVEKDGNKVAFIYKGKEYTWNDVDIASSIIASDLAKHNVHKGTHVGICGNNSINWVFTFFAIRKLGGIAVLINPKLNSAEVAKVCEIGGATHLCFAETPNITLFDEYSKICLGGSFVVYTYDISDSVDFLLRKKEFESIKNQYRESYHADDPSVIIFTSGSTGKPKAVLSSAYSISSSVSSIISNYKFCDNDINLAFLPFFHIFGLETNIIISLLKGYRSIIPEDKRPTSMIDLIEKHKCSIFNTVPTMMLAMVSDSSFDPKKLSSLRVSVLGGSATTSEQMATLKKLLPNTHFGNIYGMSENASIAITDYNDSIEHLTKTVGKPVAGMEISIRNNAGIPVDNGEIGEIFIRSDSMLVCYYKLDVNEQPIDDDGWLSTGDLGYIDEDGYLRLTGRSKDLIICCGENISPTEVNEVVSKIPSIKESKIIGVPGGIKGEVVCAAIVLKDGFVWDEEAARYEVAKHLAKFKQPTYYIVIPNFPLLGSGKIDTINLKKEILQKLNLN